MHDNEEETVRVALIADIHGNLIALDAVLADLERAGPDRVICLGDVAASGPQPRQTVERLCALSYPTIMGNADDEILNLAVALVADEPLTPSPEAPVDDAGRLMDIDRWCAAQLSSDDLDYLRTFQPTLSLPLGDGHALLCFHGSPRSFDDAITVTTPVDELDRVLAGADATILAGGHTHEQMFRRHRGSILLNPGSVGLPFERRAACGPAPDQVRNPPWAEYALVTVEGGALRIELRRAPIDAHAVVQAIHASGMPHADWLAGDWA